MPNIFFDAMSTAYGTERNSTSGSPVGRGCTSVILMRVDVISREYPPEVYGGAGVHVAELVRAMRDDIDVVVRAFGTTRDEPGVFSYGPLPELSGANAALSTLGVDLKIAQDVAGADVVHSHTWYANAAGHLASLLHGIPHVVTAHSLEPLRPWKAEQLGGGYRVSSWIESTAFAGAAKVIAVSHGMRRDILRSYPFLDEDKVTVVHNGIDLERWKPLNDLDTVRSLGIDPDRPSIVFVGRITRQKGLPYLLRAAALLPPEVQLVLCAGAPDTPEILAEVEAGVAALREQRSGVVWIDEILSQPVLSAVLTQATAFVCPSVYEPLGIVNLEAMACGVAVVGTATGGIPEVVDDGVTGRLVPIEQLQDGTGTPIDPEKFVADLARILTEVVSDPAAARVMGAAGRRRAETEFGWERIAVRTREIYASLL
jgi:starch synthase